MSADGQPNDARQVWQNDVSGTIRLSPGELRARAARLARTTRVRNYSGLVVCALLTAGWIWGPVRIADPVARVGALFTLVAVAAMAVQLASNQRGDRAIADRAASMGASSVEFHRRELERQRDFHQGWRLWTRLGLLAPGPVLFFVGFARARPQVAGTIALEAAVFVLLVLAAAPLNLRLARKYQRQLDELDRFQKDCS